jgi:hypothetical protein
LNTMLAPVRRLKRSLAVTAKRASKRIWQGPWDRSPLPVIFGNGMAKSGSHVLSQFLEGLPSVSPAVFADYTPVRTLDRFGQVKSESEVLTQIRKLQPGDIGWGYVPGWPAFVGQLTMPGHATFFIYRDPRDKIVSHILYAMHMHVGHAMHDFYHSLPSMDARISATIEGVPGMVESVRQTYESYLPWLHQPAVLAIRFEDTVSKREATLDSMLDYLELNGLPISLTRQTAKEIINRTMSPDRSPTFRKGGSGGWREHFSDRNSEEFRAKTGDLLDLLGYAW